MQRIEDGIVILKRLISDAVFSWNSRIAEATTKKKEDSRQGGRKPAERTLTTASSSSVSGGAPPETSDGYITEDTASESQLEDLSPMSADYNAVDAIAAIQADLQPAEVVENSDNELTEPRVVTNPEDIVVIQGIQLRFLPTCALLAFMLASIPKISL